MLLVDLSLHLFEAYKSWLPWINLISLFNHQKFMPKDLIPHPSPTHFHAESTLIKCLELEMDKPPRAHIRRDQKCAKSLLNNYNRWGTAISKPPWIWPPPPPLTRTAVRDHLQAPQGCTYKHFLERFPQRENLGARRQSPRSPPTHTHTQKLLQLQLLQIALSVVLLD